VAERDVAVVADAAGAVLVRVRELRRDVRVGLGRIAVLRDPGDMGDVAGHADADDLLVEQAGVPNSEIEQLRVEMVDVDVDECDPLAVALRQLAGVVHELQGRVGRGGPGKMASTGVRTRASAVAPSGSSPAAIGTSMLSR
jgi:hypothetical protein